MKHPEAEEYLQDMADMRAGWISLLKKLGGSESASAAFGVPIDPVVKSLLDRQLSTEPEAVEAYCSMLSGMLTKTLQEAL